MVHGVLRSEAPRITTLRTSFYSTSPVRASADGRDSFGASYLTSGELMMA
jgi:hypothetical protein